MNCKQTNWKGGVLFGVLGMLGFSGTLVATKVAVSDFSPLTITSGRIVIAAVLAAVTLVVLGKTRLPEKRFIPGLIWMGLGLAVGYPFFLALALEKNLLEGKPEDYVWARQEKIPTLELRGTHQVVIFFNKDKKEAYRITEAGDRPNVLVKKTPDTK